MKQLLLLIFMMLSTHLFSQLSNEHLFSTTSNLKIYDAYFGQNLTFDWSGGSKNGFVHGVGECKVYNDSALFMTYIGKYDQGYLTDTVVCIMNKRGTYECSFSKGRMRGKGTFRSENGDDYIGNIIDFMLHGDGKMVYALGTTFTGLFNRGQFWTGEYINLSDELDYYYRSYKVDAPVIVEKYSPKIGVEQTEYFDENWHFCSKSDATYFRKITYDEDYSVNGRVKDFYINGLRHQEYNLRYFNHADNQLMLFDEGERITYYEDQSISKIERINCLGNINGQCHEYYPNGRMKSISNYDMYGDRNGHYFEFSEAGEPTLYAEYKDDKLIVPSYYLIDDEGNWEFVIFEDFQDKSSFWGEESPNQSFTSDEGLFILGNKNSDYQRLIEVDVQDIDRYRLRLSVSALAKQFRKNAHIGLVFNYENSSNYSLFVIEAKKSAIKVLDIKNDHVYTLFESTVPEIWSNRDELNYNLQILNWDGDVVYFILNGEVLHVEKNFNVSNLFDYGPSIGGQCTFLLEDLRHSIFIDEEKSAHYSKWLEAEINPSDDESEYRGNGSGFFISKKGHILTNYHVIEDAKEIDIQIYRNGEMKTFPAMVVVQDKVNDLAILKIKTEGFELNENPPFVIDFNAQDVGSAVYTLGYPMTDVMGSEIKFTDGRISARSGHDGDIRVYQISAPIQPGNSGGPLFNEKGDVIGIIASTLNRAEYNTENVNYAIKSNLIRNLIESSNEEIELITSSRMQKASITDKIKVYQNYIPLILIK